MRILIDSHTVHWYTSGDPKLSKRAEETLKSDDSEAYLSMASLWEIAIKVGLGKWDMHKTYEEFLDMCINQFCLRILPITEDHLLEASRLPYPTKHRDPFDRMLIAQALSEQLSIVSIDEAFDAYGVSRIW